MLGFLLPEYSAAIIGERERERGGVEVVSNGYGEERERDGNEREDKEQ